jgi:hypothetical protein
MCHIPHFFAPPRMPVAYQPQDPRVPSYALVSRGAVSPVSRLVAPSWDEHFRRVFHVSWAHPPPSMIRCALRMQNAAWVKGSSAPDVFPARSPRRTNSTMVLFSIMPQKLISSGAKWIEGKSTTPPNQGTEQLNGETLKLMKSVSEKSEKSEDREMSARRGDRRKKTLLERRLGDSNDSYSECQERIFRTNLCALPDRSIL